MTIPLLKYTTLRMHPNYYTFSGIPERRGNHYKDFKMLKNDIHRNDRYFIDLTWKENLKLNFR
jgi:hypothetical protein